MTFLYLILTSWLTMLLRRPPTFSWIVFPKITRLEWQRKTMGKLSSLHHWEHIIIKSCLSTSRRITYQREMVMLFHDMMHKIIEVYMDKMIDTSKEEENHVQILKKLFDILNKYKLKLNPIKFTFGVRYGKLLGFVVNN